MKKLQKILIIQILFILIGVSCTFDKPGDIRALPIEYLIKYKQKLVNKQIITSGYLNNKSKNYFKPDFEIEFNEARIDIIAWLPLEIAPSPDGKNKVSVDKAMGYYLGKKIEVQGILKLDKNGRPYIKVIKGKVLK